MSKVEEKPVCEKRKTTFWEKARERKVKIEERSEQNGRKPTCEKEKTFWEKARENRKIKFEMKPQNKR